MISFSRCAAALGALGLLAGASIAPALADDLDLGTDLSGPATGIAWDTGTGEALLVDAAGTISAVDGETGAVRSVTFSGSPESVQGLALFEGLLHVADIGDPEDSREFVTIFRVDPSSEDPNYRAWDFRYADGAHDASAMAVSGKGRFYVVTTGEDPGIYRAELQPSRADVNELTRAADAPDGVTDAVFLADGATLLLRTADGVEVLDAYTWESTALTTYVDADEGESITTFGDGRMLVGNSSLLRDEPLPEGITTVTPGPSPEPTPSPSPSPVPEVSPEPSPSAVGPEPSEVSRRGTFIALLGGAVVAVLAGVVVFVVRD